MDPEWLKPADLDLQFSNKIYGFCIVSVKRKIIHLSIIDSDIVNLDTNLQCHSCLTEYLVKYMLSCITLIFMLSIIIVNDTSQKGTLFHIAAFMSI